MSWLYSQYLTFHRKLLVVVSRIQKSGIGDKNFGKWKGIFPSDRPKWPDQLWRWSTVTGPEYSGRTKPKWSIPFNEPTEISGILGWLESAPGNNFRLAGRDCLNIRIIIIMGNFSGIGAWYSADRIGGMLARSSNISIIVTDKYFLVFRISFRTLFSFVCVIIL